VHPVLRDRRALVAYLAAWVILSYVPASLVASPGGGRFLLAVVVVTPPTLLFGLGALPLYYLCRAMPLRPGSLVRVLRVQGAAALVWALVWLGLLEAAARLVDWAAGVGLTELVERRLGALLAIGGLLYFAVAGSHYLVVSAQRARASERRAATAFLQLREAQLALLKAQIHPHFLFNSLNAVSALTVADPRMARELCVRLADFLRRSLAMGERGMVRLSDELELVGTYLGIERIRLGDRLDVDLQVSPPAGEARIPALLLQPLVENAITHGIATMAEGGTLSIAARTTPAMLVVTIGNPFDPQAPPPRRAGQGGVGLANVSRRLAASDHGASLATRRDPDRFTVVVTLPTRLDGVA